MLPGLQQGLSEKQIATVLKISQHTVHSHTKKLYRHYGVQSRGELLALWIRTDLPVRELSRWR